MGNDISFASFPELRTISIGPALAANFKNRIDVSKNEKLVNLRLRYMQINTIDLSKNINLESLEILNNNQWKQRLKKLDLSKNTKLKYLNCTGNELTELDLKENKELVQLECAGNYIKDLDLTANTKLRWLQCAQSVPDARYPHNIVVKGYQGNNQYNEDDKKALSALIQEQKAKGAAVKEDISDTQYGWAYDKVSETARLYLISWSGCNLQGKLSFKGLPKLRLLQCSENQLTGIDVSENEDLEYLFLEK